MVREHPFQQPIADSIFEEGILPRGISALGAEDKDHFMHNAFVCRAVDRKLAKTIGKTITVRSYRRKLLDSLDHSGLKLLRWIEQKLNDVGPFANTAIGQKMFQLEKSGPEARTVAAWNRWQEEWDGWNASQSEEAVLSDALVAGRYETAARQLGEPIAGNV